MKLSLQKYKRKQNHFIRRLRKFRDDRSQVTDTVPDFRNNSLTSADPWARSSGLFQAKGRQ